MNVLLIILDFIVIYVINEINAANVTISTALGNVIGIAQNNYVTFKGIPYTENSPIGDYRFTESTVKTTPYQNNIYDATYYRYGCIQGENPYFLGEQSEDCLYLNIFTQNININGAVSAPLLPVMVWIHGGAFLYQAASLYNGESFMTKSNVIIVTINYRLSALGFLSAQSILNETNSKFTGGMNGINDQIVALQWVQNNIHEYGGNSNKVTIFGESAGGFSVCYLSLIPRAAGLFNQAIIQSGHCSIPQPWGSPAAKQTGLDASLAIMTSYGLQDDLMILRSANASIFSTMWVSPSVDGYLLQDTTHNMLIKNEFTANANNIMIGSTSLDTLVLWPWFFSFGSRAPVNDNEFDAYLNQYINDQSDRELIKNTYYPLSDFAAAQYKSQQFSSHVMRWGVMNADVCFKCGQTWYLQKILNNANSNINNLYLYDFIGPQSIDYATHGAEIVYLFPDIVFTLDFLGLIEDDSLSDLLIDQWINFGIYGVPNSTLATDEWLPYQMNQSGMVLGTNNAQQSNYNVMNFNSQGYRNGVCDFWTNHIGWDVIAALCMEVHSLQPTTAPTIHPTQSESAGIETSVKDISSESSAADDSSSVTIVLVVMWLIIFVIIAFIVAVVCYKRKKTMNNTETNIEM